MPINGAFWMLQGNLFQAVDSVPLTESSSCVA